MGMTGWRMAFLGWPLAAALVLVAGSAAAQQPAQQPAADGAAHTKLFLDTFLNRCMPAAHAGTAVDTAGMTRVESPLDIVWLNGMEGSVWNPDPRMQVVMVERAAGGCLVLSALGDAAAVEAALGESFDAAGSGFEREHFKRTADGSFQAFYRTGSCAAALGCRVIVNARGGAESSGLAMMAGAAQIKE